MIKNERQYKISRSQFMHLTHVFNEVRSQVSAPGGTHPLLQRFQEDALSSQITDLEEEIHEYEALKNGEFQFQQLTSIVGLPRLLIMARIASGLSQRELADRMGLKEQQIQRYEATEYESASFARIRSVVTALGLTFDESLFHEEEAFTFKDLFQRVSKTGLEKDFILRRLFPLKGLSSISTTSDEKGNVASRTAAETFAKMFQWPLPQLKGKETLELGPPLGQFRFKLAANAQPERVKAYAMYAFYLSQLVIKTCTHIPLKSIPTDPHVLCKAIESDYDEMSLSAIVNYVWKLGVAVLPLDDPSAFHGAFIRINGRNVIFLKQKTSSESRWAFDLLHELWHAGQEPELPERSVLEQDEMSVDRRESEEETTANRFAAAVLLRGRGTELAEKCINLAKSDLSRLKRAVLSVAEEEKVQVDDLANYLASRIASEQGENWWGTANSLQSNENPCALVRNLFFEHADFNKLSEPDRELLAQALIPWEREIYV